MRFRRKPFDVSAVQLLWENWQEMCDFADVGKLEDGKPQGCSIGADGHPLPEGESSMVLGLLIPTRSGLAVARQGDWVVRDPDEKLYPIQRQMFPRLYEPVDPLPWWNDGP
jgi:hypothetical protein